MYTYLYIQNRTASGRQGNFTPCFFSIVNIIVIDDHYHRCFAKCVDTYHCRSAAYNQNGDEFGPVPHPFSTLSSTNVVVSIAATEGAATFDLVGAQTLTFWESSCSATIGKVPQPFRSMSAGILVPNTGVSIGLWNSIGIVGVHFCASSNNGYLFEWGSKGLWAYFVVYRCSCHY